MSLRRIRQDTLDEANVNVHRSARVCPGEGMSLRMVDRLIFQSDRDSAALAIT